MSPPPPSSADAHVDADRPVACADCDARLSAVACELSAALPAADDAVHVGQLRAAALRLTDWRGADGDHDSPLAAAVRGFVEQLGAALWGSSVHFETVIENTEAREGERL